MAPTVSALKIDAKITTSSLKLKGGSLSQITKQVKNSSRIMTPLLGHHLSMTNGMRCTKSASAYTILLAVGENGESMMILKCGTTALSRTLKENGSKKKFSISMACLFVSHQRLRRMKLPKLKSIILLGPPEPKLTGVSALNLILVQLSQDPSFPIRTAIWTDWRPISESWKTAIRIAKSSVLVLALSLQSTRSPLDSLPSTCSALSLAHGDGEQECSLPTAPTSAAASSSSS